MPPPALLWYGDDFTGATDTLGTATRAGLRALLFLRRPTDGQLAAAGALDCVGLAGAARSMDPDAMRAELAGVVPLFRRLGARVLHYKLCSTFDSAPAVGSIGVALQTLRAALPGVRTAIVGGQPDLGRYCVFGNLFARAGSAGEVHRIDRHPTMACHPVTPMGEADLRRHLALQGLERLGLLPLVAVRDAPLALQAQWDALADTAPDGVLFDVADNADLDRIGALLWREAQRAPLLVAGASGVVQALAPAIAPRRPNQAALAVAPARGPVLVLAGSLSPETAEQVRNATSYETIWLDPQALVGQRADAAQRITALLRQGRHVLACTVAPGQAAPQAIDARALALAGGSLLAEVLRAVPLARVGVAGGDTSSYAVRALDAWGLSYLAAAAPGVALCRLHSDDAALDGTEIALKGGQMGTPDLFERLVHGT
jgi:3-oxoisoapionate kinase